MPRLLHDLEEHRAEIIQWRLENKAYSFIIEQLNKIHSVKVSERTLRSRFQRWEVTNQRYQKKNAILEKNHEDILELRAQGASVLDIRYWLYGTTSILISNQTIHCYLKREDLPPLQTHSIFSDSLEDELKACFFERHMEDKDILHF